MAEQAGSRTLVLHGWLRNASEMCTGMFRSPRIADFDGCVDGPQGTRWRVSLCGWGLGEALQRYHALVTCEWPLSAATAAPSDLSMDVDVRVVIAEHAFALAWQTAVSEGQRALLEGCNNVNAVIAAPSGGTQRVELKRPLAGAASAADAAPPCAYVGRHVAQKDCSPITNAHPPGAIVADTVAMKPLLGGGSGGVDLPVFVYITVKRVRYAPVVRCQPSLDDAAWPPSGSGSPLATLKSTSGSSSSKLYKHRTWTSHTGDAREKVGIVGISNQGATCYLNSLLQTLFHTRLMRKIIYEAPVEWTPAPAAPVAAAPASAAGSSGLGSSAITIDDDDGDMDAKPSSAAASVITKPPQWSDYEWAKAKPASTAAAAAGAASSARGSGNKQPSAAAAPTDPGVISDRTRVVAALQSQFLDMEAGLSKTATTTALTKSFGWTSTDAFVQHDVQELSKVCVAYGDACDRQRGFSSICSKPLAPSARSHPLRWCCFSPFAGCWTRLRRASRAPPCSTVSASC